MKSKLFLLFPFLYLFILLLQPTIEMTEDLGRQIKMGEIIAHCLCIPQNNLFSYTFETFPIVNYSWLSSVIYYFFAHTFGLESLFVFKIVIFLSIFAILYLALQKKVGMFWFTIFMVVAINIFFNRLVMRPEIFSFILFSLFLFVIEKSKQTKNYNPLFILPFLQLIWVNVHVFFFMGSVLYVFFLVERMIQTKSLPNRKLLLIFLLIIAINLLNPQFLLGALYPILTISNYGPQIDENLSPFTNNPLLLADYAYHIWFFEATIVLFFIAIFINIKKTPIFLVFSALFFMVLSFKLIRIFPLFAIASVLPLTIMYSEEPVFKRMDKYMNTGIKIAISIILLFLVTLQLKNLVINKRIQPVFITDRLNGVKFVKENNIHGPIFNSLGIGGNIIYQLYPQEKVYIDARPDAYPINFMSNYQKHFTDIKFFNTQSKKYNFNTLIIARYENYYWTGYLVDALIKSKNWKMVYLDDWMVIVVKNNGKNKSIIEKFEVVGMK